MKCSSNLLRPLSRLVCALPVRYLHHLRPTLSRLVDYLAHAPPPAQQVRYIITRHCQTYGINLGPHAEVSAYIVHERTGTPPAVQQSTSPPPQHPSDKGSGGLSMSLHQNTLDSHNGTGNNCTSLKRNEDLHHDDQYRGNQSNNSWREGNTQIPQFHVVKKACEDGETALLHQNLFKMVKDLIDHKSSSDDAKLQVKDNEQLMNSKYQSESQNIQSKNTQKLKWYTPVDHNKTENIKDIKSACALFPERFRTLNKKFESSVAIKPHQPQQMNQEYHDHTSKLPASQKLQSDYQAQCTSQVGQIQMPVLEMFSNVEFAGKYCNSSNTQVSNLKRKEHFPALQRKSELSKCVFEAEYNGKDEDKALVMPLELFSCKVPRTERTVEEEGQALVIPLELSSGKVSCTGEAVTSKADGSAVDEVLKKNSCHINLKRSLPYTETGETDGVSSKQPRLSAASDFDEELQILDFYMISRSSERKPNVSPKQTTLSREDNCISIENNGNIRKSGTSHLQEPTSSQVKPSLTKSNEVDPHTKETSEDKQGDNHTSQVVVLY